jgi:hypothetical protein
VATIADHSSAVRPAKASISAHPAFPVIVALWFAAFLGLGSLVLPVELLERLVTVTHIASVVPAAEPPLGFTARAGIALAASIAGAVIGLLLARRVANASAPEPRGRNLQIGADRECRPISAHDEFGDDDLDSSAATPLQHKRRSLAMAEDDRPSAYLRTVPLPGQLVDDWDDAPAPDETAFATDDEPLELSVFSQPGDEPDQEPAEASANDGPQAFGRRVHTSDTSALQDTPMADSIFRHPAAIDEDDAEAQDFGQQGQSPWQTFDAEPADPDPLAFAAPSLRRSLASAADEPEGAEPSPVAKLAEVDDTLAEDAALRLAIVEAEGDDDRPLEELGLVQLAARLGASIEKRRAWSAERQSHAVPPQPDAPFGEAEDFEAAEPEEAARAIADFFGPPSVAHDRAEAPVSFASPEASDPCDLPSASSRAAVPAALREIQPEADEDFGLDELDRSLSLPLGSTPAASCESPSHREDAEYDEVESDEGDYSSLLAMKNPFARQQDFVRVEELEDESDSIEPAVTFPSAHLAVPAPRVGSNGTAPAMRPFDPPKNPEESVRSTAAAAATRDPGDAERSLRDALATLQRMSGTA